eukprot:gene2434-5374_t
MTCTASTINYTKNTSPYVTTTTTRIYISKTISATVGCPSSFTATNDRSTITTINGARSTSFTIIVLVALVVLPLENCPTEHSSHSKCRNIATALSMFRRHCDHSLHVHVSERLCSLRVHMSSRWLVGCHHLPDLETNVQVDSDFEANIEDDDVSCVEEISLPRRKTAMAESAYKSKWWGISWLGYSLTSAFASNRSFQSCPGSIPRIRLLNRRGNFEQSDGKFNMSRLFPNVTVASLHIHDWFHTLLSWSTPGILFFLCSLYTTTVLVWASFYYAVTDQCGLEISQYGDAVMLSIETQATIGYGVPSSYFEHCNLGPLLVLSQTLVGLFVDALFIGVIFARISRGNNRAYTIVFSNKAIIREINGKVCDMKKHSLVEAHVRMYTIRHKLASQIRKHRTVSTSELSRAQSTPTNTVWFQTHAMRLTHPNDELGSMLLLSLPDQVIHHIDAWSPLMPQTVKRLGDHDPVTSFLFPEPLLRTADAFNGGKPTISEFYSASNCYCVAIFGNSCCVFMFMLFTLSSGRGSSSDTPQPVLKITREQIIEKIKKDNIEVLCIVEGVDATTSYTIQACHSYTLDDIVFEHQFAPCVRQDAQGACVLDLTTFHMLLPLNPHLQPEDQVSSIL